ncbi:MAG: type II toxin-antitoxin system HicB family antitoxin [Clostridium sp.]|nr:type II toxin-antitoxin system HicB family antitoxin [Clostridium sp.]
MYKENYIFPAIISKLADDDYNVKFVDFEEIITYGRTLEEAYDMAEDALKLEIFDLYSDKLDIPLATDINKIKTNNVETIILVRVNLVKILKEYDNRSVKKTLTIPSWMNEMAESKKINFSQVLQEALKNKLEL